MAMALTTGSSRCMEAWDERFRAGEDPTPDAMGVANSLPLERAMYEAIAHQ